MSKRRINKQQSARIEQIQKKYQKNKAEKQNALFDGLVLSRFGRHAEIEPADGGRILCSIRPNLETLVAGDRVIYQAQGDAQGVVVSLYPRTSVLMRPTGAAQKKPVAANITQMIIVIAPKPEISWSLLDSYLIIAETLHLKAVILHNKTDLPCEESTKRLASDYQPLNYSIIKVSREQPQSISLLQEQLKHEVSVFVGQSGVGKSSLISALLPHEEHIITNQISSISQLGKHTTSNSRYYHLPVGGALIDSPGVREFSLSDVDASTLVYGYNEFKPYLSGCKFRNCTHISTTHCAIIEAVDRGLISRGRYENFKKLYLQFSQSHIK